MSDDIIHSMTTLVDMMPIDMSIASGLPLAVHVEGWDRMVDKHPMRAAVLQALANSQLRVALSGGPAPTQKVIITEIARNGLMVYPNRKIDIRLSLSSIKEINRHINSHLIPAGYIVTRQDYEEHHEQKRGGPSAPWQVVAISELLRSRFNPHRITNDSTLVK